MSDGASDVGDQEVRLLLRLEFRPGSGDIVADTLQPNVVLTRKEEGCLDFQVYRVDGSDVTFAIFEHWRSQADLDAHWKMPYMAHVFGLFETYLVRPLSDADDVDRLTDIMVSSQ